MARNILLFDEAGTQIASQECKSKAARMSMQASADQRQLNDFIKDHPAATTAALVFPSGYRVNFKIRADRTSWAV